ncbi:MAG: hypothetical protein WC584_00145 [Candidatus Pacearchaeota archaeon]
MGFKKFIKYHLIDTTAIITFSTPFFVFLENAISKISDLNSIRARAYAIILSFLGLGKLISGGRDLSRKLFHITHKTNEKIQIFHDAIYLGIFNLLTAPIIYFIAGETNFFKILSATLLTSIFALFIGAPMGFFIDSFRDLSGLKKCERKIYPKKLHLISKISKIILLILLILISLIITLCIYLLTPN